MPPSPLQHHRLDRRGGLRAQPRYSPLHVVRHLAAKRVEALRIVQLKHRHTSLGIDAETGVVVIELHDPERFNTMGWALGDDMSRAVKHLRRYGGVRAITLQGAGSVFCAGGNPYGGSSGPLSLAMSSRRLLASTQVCLRDNLPFVCAPCHPYLCAAQGFVDVRELRVPVVGAVHGMHSVDLR